MAKKVSLEESFEQLETIIEQMKTGDMTLEDSFKKYEEGMKLINSMDGVEAIFITKDEKLHYSENFKSFMD